VVEGSKGTGRYPFAGGGNWQDRIRCRPIVGMAGKDNFFTGAKEEDGETARGETFSRGGRAGTSKEGKGRITTEITTTRGIFVENT